MSDSEIGERKIIVEDMKLKPKQSQRPDQFYCQNGDTLWARNYFLKLYEESKHRNNVPKVVADQEKLSMDKGPNKELQKATMIIMQVVSPSYM